MEMGPNISIVLPRHMPGKNPESLSWKNGLSVMIKKKLRIFLMQLARVSKSAVHEPYIISNLAP